MNKCKYAYDNGKRYKPKLARQCKCLHCKKDCPKCNGWRTIGRDMFECVIKDCTGFESEADDETA